VERVGYPVLVARTPLASIELFAGDLVLAEKQHSLLDGQRANEFLLLDPGTLLARYTFSLPNRLLAACSMTAHLMTRDADGGLALLHVPILPAPASAPSRELRLLDEVGKHQLLGAPLGEFQLARDHGVRLKDLADGLSLEKGLAKLTWKGWTRCRFKREAMSAAGDLLDAALAGLRACPPQFELDVEQLCEEYGLVDTQRALLLAVATAIHLEYVPGQVDGAGALSPKLALPAQTDVRLNLATVNDVASFVAALERGLP
jgi:hypothetical protein